MALQSRQRDIQSALHAASVGQVVDVLVDSVARRHVAELSGRTSGNTVVNFPVPTGTRADPDLWLGRTVPILVTRAGPNSVAGELAAPEAAVPAGAVTC